MGLGLSQRTRVHARQTGGDEVGGVGEGWAGGSLTLLHPGSQALKVRTPGLAFEVRTEKVA